MANQPGLSVAEREVLKVLWDHGPGPSERSTRCSSTGAGTGPIRRWRRCFSGWWSRGMLVSDPSAVPHVYRAVVAAMSCSSTAQGCRRRAMRRPGGPLVLALVQGNRFSAEELARLRRLLDEAAAGSSSSSKSKS